MTNQPKQQPQSVSIPILATDVRLAVLDTPDGARLMVEWDNVLGSGRFFCDRNQAIDVAKKIDHFARKMKEPPRIEVPRLMVPK